jgi:hypothetical protein
MKTGKPEKDMIVSHGPFWHISKPGFAGVQCYTVAGMMVMKDMESAKQLCKMHMINAEMELNYEEGALRYTIFEPM